MTCAGGNEELPRTRKGDTVKRLSGILVAMVTPMGRTQLLDLEALRELVEFFVEAGIHGVYLLLKTDSTGTVPALPGSTAERPLSRLCLQ